MTADTEVDPHLRVRVPFVDLSAQTAVVREAVIEDWQRVLETGAFVNGSAVEMFEHAFADWCGRKHCVGTASGLDALRLGLIGAGLEPGDEVAVPAMTFVATFEAVVQAGGVPVPVDVCEVDVGIDVDALAAVVGERTRFVMPVHLYGQLVDHVHLNAFAEGAGLTVIEDACQAHGATRDGALAGTVGHAAGFSFYASKNLGAFGDAGALVTDDEDLAARVRALREHGQMRRYESHEPGYTARLDTIQAVVLLHKLKHLDSWNGERRRLADMYSEALADVGDLSIAGCGSPGDACLAPLHGSNARAGAPCRVPLDAWHRNWSPLPPAAPPLAGVLGARASRGVVPRRRGDRPRDPVAPALPGHDRRPARGGRRRRHGVLRACLTVPATSLRTG